MNKDQNYYYEVKTREEVRDSRCGEVGDILKKSHFSIYPIISVRQITPSQLEVHIEIDENRRQEILDLLQMGLLQVDAGYYGIVNQEEVFVVEHAFLSIEEAKTHAIKLIEDEISHLRKKQETLSFKQKED